MKKMIFVILGLLFFILGAIGAVLPILPTTPFLLVSAACFTKGSKRFNIWFLNTKLYKRHLDSFVKKHSMTLESKIKICGFASIMLLFAFFMMNNIYGRICIVCVMAFKYYYFIFRIHTIKPDKDLNKQFKKGKLEAE